MTAARVRDGFTKRDHHMNAWGTAITLPADTRCHLILGGQGYHWAVASSTLMVELTGNTHDPHYRWCFVPDELVTPQGEER